MNHLMQMNHEQHFFAREDVDPLPHAFEKKAVIHPGMMGGKRIPQDQASTRWTELLHTERHGKTVAYFHLPFCENRCPFCKNGPVHAVYFGGGTPTAFDADDLKRLLQAVRRCLPLAGDCEITVEGRIYHFDPQKMEACFEGGANRFSIGVQSFDTDIRRSMGRIASRDTVLRSLEKLRDMDRGVVVIDLIYGLPGQTMDIWRDDVSTLLELGLDGADLYQLNVFHGGPLEQAIQSAKVPPAADIPQQSEMFANGVALMQKARYRRLSICHWGNGTRERNIYNQLMKSGAHCLAYGSGAGGSLHGYEYFTINDLEQYRSAIRQDTKPLMMLMTPPKHHDFIKFLTGQLELGRIDLRRASRTFQCKLESIYQPLLEQWQRVGLIELDQQGWLTLTLAGEFWQVNLTQALIQYFNMFSQKAGNVT
ncbi:heme anaerobic degradation radical SAM methyltransferase ChuW/HutW [candidate division KSB3 bacterium]|nr:MAG: heme anaerobic degradation radical SAM methyltransferase ChuW/HutW [candidate division KSB3 bacterium]